MKCLELELPFNVRVEVYIADSQTALFAARQLDFYLKSNQDVELEHDCDVYLEFTYDGLDSWLVRDFFFNELKCNSWDSLFDIYHHSHFWLDSDKFIYEVKIARTIFQRIRGIFRSNYTRLHSEYYTLILAPILLLFKNAIGVDIVHGSAIAYRGKAIIFTGLGGTGKSSLLLEAQKKGASVIGDNILFLYGNQVIRFITPVRSSSNKSTHGQQVVHHDNRIIEEIPLKITEQERQNVSGVFLLRKTSARTNLKRNLRISHEWLKASSWQAPELEAFNVFFEKKSPFFQVRKNKGLTEVNVFYELEIAPGDFLKAQQLIENAIKNDL